MTTQRSPTLAGLLDAAVQRGLAGLRVSVPARVERYDPATQAVDVKPLVRDFYEGEDGSTQSESLPVVTNVPVLFPGAGGFRVTFPVARGDVVLLVFADRSLDVWKSKGGEVDPADPRRHHLSDAVAIPGLFDLRAGHEAHAENVVIGKADGARVELTPSGDVVLNGGGREVARKGDAVSLGGTALPAPTGMLGWMAQVTATLNGLVSGSVTVTPTEVGTIAEGAPNVKA